MYLNLLFLLFTLHLILIFHLFFLPSIYNLTQSQDQRKIRTLRTFPKNSLGPLNIIQKTFKLENEEKYLNYKKQMLVLFCFYFFFPRSKIRSIISVILKIHVKWNTKWILSLIFFYPLYFYLSYMWYIY